MKRDKSVLTNGEIEELSSIEKFPVFIGDTPDDKSTDIFTDLTFDICKDTGIIQLRNLVDPNLIYAKYHSEAIGKLWDTHHNMLAQLISKYVDNKNILEIGGSNSQLALITFSLNKNIKNWTIIDPVLKSKIIHEKLSYIEGFFDEKTYNDNKYDTIIHSHVLEHMIDPVVFLSLISNFIDYSQYHIFSVPNMYAWLKNKSVNTITFEHTLLLTEEIIDYLLSQYNFVIEEKIYCAEHSIFYVTKKQKTNPLELPNKYDEYKQMYLTCINHYKQYIDELNEKLEKTTKDVYLFGAAFVSQYLIALGLNISKIKFILDNSKLKNGNRLYGSNLIIKSPYDIKLNSNSLVILKCEQYKEEIKKQLLDIDSNIEFYERN